MKSRRRCCAGMLVFLSLVWLSGGLRAADPKEALLHATGGLTAQGMLLGYESIGAVADAYSKQVYDKDTASQLLQSCANVIERVRAQLDELQESGALEGEDIKFIAQSVETFDLLASEAKAYRNYILNGDQADLEVFGDKRKAAWAKIKTLLKIED